MNFLSVYSTILSSAVETRRFKILDIGSCGVLRGEHLKVFFSDSSLNGGSFKQGANVSLCEYLLNEEHV